MNRRSDRLVLACVALSLLLHALVLAVFRERPSTRANGGKRVPPIEVTLRAYEMQAKPAREARPVRKSARAPGTRSGVMTAPAETKEAAAPPATAPPAASGGEPVPRVDWEAARRIAGETDRATRKQSASDLPALFPTAPESETPLGRAIASAARPDCRIAYAGAGLFAVLFFIKDQIADDGCKW